MQAIGITSPRALRVSEVFGPTIQGEGPTTGRRAAFLRLAGCNLDCSWCDTPYTWDWRRFDPKEQIRRVNPDKLHEQLDAMGVNLVVITGGEPLLQQDGILRFMRTFALTGMEFEIETNGTRAPDLAFLDPGLAPRVRFNVAPKLSNSGVDYEDRIKPGVLVQFASFPRTAFKFVVQHAADLDEVEAIVAVHALPARQVWLMPEGTTRTELDSRAEFVADAAIERGWNFTHRTHIALWGNTRGR